MTFALTRPSGALTLEDSRRNKRKEANLVSHMPYWEIVDGAMYLSGKYTSGAELGFRLTLPCMAFYDESQMAGLWESLKLVLRLGTPRGARTRILIRNKRSDGEVISAYHAGKTDPNPIARRITLERTQHLQRRLETGKLRDWEVILCCHFPGKKGTKSYSPAEFKLFHGRISAARARIERFLDDAGFQPHILGDQEVFALCHAWFNPEHHDPPRYQPRSERQYLSTKQLEARTDTYVNSTRFQIASSNVDNTHWDHLRIGSRFVTTLSLRSTPSETEIGMIATTLMRLAHTDFWLVCDFRKDDDTKIRRTLERNRRGLSAGSKQEGFSPDAANAVAEQEHTAALEVMQKGGDAPFNTGVSVVLIARSEDALTVARERATSALSRLSNLSVVAGTVENCPQFLRHLAPFAGGLNQYNFLTLDSNAAHYLPIAAPWRGSKHPTSIYTTRWNSLVGIDWFDPANASWNAVVVGGTGSGKSYFVQGVACDLYAEGGEVIIVDKGYSYRSMIEALGSQGTKTNLILLGPGLCSFNPLELPPEQVQPTPEDLNWAKANLLIMLKLRDGDEGVRQDVILGAAIEQTYLRAYTEYLDNESGEFIQKRDSVYIHDLARTLTDLESVGNQRMEAHDRVLAQSLALQLQRWIGDSHYGSFVDRDTSFDASGRMVYFETTGLEGHPELEAISLLFIARLVRRRAEKNRAVKKLLIFDEQWQNLKNAYARNLVSEYYRTARKFGMGVWSSTQRMADALGFEAMLENTAYFVLGRITPEDAAIARQNIHLPSYGADLLPELGSATGSDTREFLIWQLKQGGAEGDIVQFRVDQYSHWTFTTHHEHVARREALQKQFGLLRALDILSEESTPRSEDAA